MAQTLSLTDITKDFGGGPVLAGISLNIEPGELVAVMGPSGSGKSTLLHCMSGVLTPTHGSVRYGDEELSALSDAPRSRTRLRNFGFVFQDGQLLPELSNVDNVALPLLYAGVGASERRRRALELLERMGLGRFADSLPSQMSGGQQQRVAIARALVNRPQLLLADEPTGNLDTQTGAEIMRMLVELNQRHGLTIVLVTHEPAIAAYAHRLVGFLDGQVVHDGEVATGLALPPSAAVEA